MRPAFLSFEGRQYILWYRMASPNSDADGTRFDGESSMILRNENGELGLGGDFEEQELSQMRRLDMLLGCF